MLINFNSPEQTTKLFQLIDPTIESSGVEVVSKLDHPIATEFRKFSKAAKLVSSYGENFIDWVAPDGQIRVGGFNQILGTGRSSMKLFQLLPQDNNYRNCFQPNNPITGKRDDGHVWKMIGVDYSSQEICVVASFAGEESMLEALENGYDLHSISASLLFPDEWKRLGGEEKPKDKPRKDQVELNKFRNWSKSTSFGLFYGMSAVGLADVLGLPATTIELMDMFVDETAEFLLNNDEEYTLYCNEYKKGRKSKSSLKDFLKKCHEEGTYLGDVVTGDDLVQRFYRAYPKVRAFLLEKGETAKQLLHVRTPDDFGRIRFFDEPEHESGYGAIERAAMNMPIQA
jgi:DNA polymerase I-like protein with 3'-5' exonuclease and polymerase domains